MWSSHWSLWPYLQDAEPAYQLCNFVWQAVNAVRKSILSAQWAERTPVDTCKSQPSVVSHHSRVSLCSSTARKGSGLTTISIKGQPGPFLDFWVHLGVWHPTRMHQPQPGTWQHIPTALDPYVPAHLAQSLLNLGLILVWCRSTLLLPQNTQNSSPKFLSGSLLCGLMVEPQTLKVKPETSEFLECLHRTAGLLWPFLSTTE